MIDIYNDTRPTELRYLARAIGARIRMQGFIVIDFFPRMDEFYRDMAGLLQAGKLDARETVHEGLEAMPRAFLEIGRGSWRERVWTYVSNSVVAGALKNKHVMIVLYTSEQTPDTTNTET